MYKPILLRDALNEMILALPFMIYKIDTDKVYYVVEITDETILLSNKRRIKIKNITDQYILASKPTKKQIDFITDYLGYDTNDMCSYQAHNIISDYINGDLDIFDEVDYWLDDCLFWG